MLLRNKVVKKIGFFDEKFFMFGEDLDYCFRIKESGYNILYYPETEIIHYKGESVKHAPIDMIKVFYSAMNVFFEKYQDKYPSWKLMKWLIKVGISLEKWFHLLKAIYHRFFLKF